MHASQSVKEAANRQNAEQIKPSPETGRWQPAGLTDVVQDAKAPVKLLAAQGILTYCITPTLPYYLYADEWELFVLAASLTSASLSKISF